MWFRIDLRSVIIRAVLELTLTHPSAMLFRFATFGVLIAAFLLAGCGRKGPLDLPPSDSTPPAAESQPGVSGMLQGTSPAQRSSAPIEYSVEGKPLAPRGQKKKLPGDVLID
jgi:predicted small lipoprotein YifL